MTDIPRSALVLGLAGLIPFVWGAATYLHAPLAAWGVAHLVPWMIGPYVSLLYGTVILSFMSGVLWGFATKAEGAVATSGYVLSVLPALWAFFFQGAGPVTGSIALGAGFLAVLAIDYMFWSQGLAPPWWMKLRVLLTTIVLACLAVIAFL